MPIGWIQKKWADQQEIRAEQQRVEAEHHQARLRREREKERVRIRQVREARERLVALEAANRRLQQDIISILESGKIPAVSADGMSLAFRFMKSEHLIFVFTSVGYAEMKTKREVVGRSAGTSIRVMKGVYVRAGASRGTPVETDEVVDRGTGMLAVTTKHIYFNGQRSFRIRLDKIVSIEKKSDGVAVTRDRVRAQPEYFTVGKRDAWFLYEMIQAIPSLELPSNDVERESPESYGDYKALVLGDGDSDLIGDSGEDS